MAGWVIANMGGEMPLKDARLLPDGQATAAWNVDLSSGRVEGLPSPELVIDLTSRPGIIEKAYRFPGPNPAVDADVWLPLPSPYSSVVRSPLVNDDLHRIYWTNPGQGGYWNTYARLRDNLPNYKLGFLPVEPYWLANAVAYGGSIPRTIANSATVVNAGGGAYVPGQELTVVGGSVKQDQTATRVVITHTRVIGIQIVSAGSGGTDGPTVIGGTTGTGQRFQIFATLVGGAIWTTGEFVLRGVYATNPTNVLNEPVINSDGTLTGAILILGMGVLDVNVSNAGDYDYPPVNPVATTGTTGTDCTLDIVWSKTGIPPISRSYLFTYVDEYGQESAPSTPSAVVEGASDGNWTVYGLSNVPPISYDTNKIYPNTVAIRIYRTVTGLTTGGQFYRVVDIAMPTGIDPSVGWIDTVTDSEVVQLNLVLESTAWGQPPATLDGLIAMAGGMLVGFSGNTLHFCEPNRPNVWVTSYDLSVGYEIVGLAVWQAALMVLTKGFPSTGQGTSPGAFTVTQVQTTEPCISRGSIVTDLLGVYYASENGLIMLNYYGMTNQTLALISKREWLLEFGGAQLIACRHRSQYLALNEVGAGFLIDYAEQRLGVVRINTLNTAVSIWNDIYTGEVFIMAGRKVYRWDSPNTPPLVWRWRSKRFSLPQPVNLGAAQVTLDPSVTDLSLAVAPLGDDDVTMTLPEGVNALFRVFIDEDVLIYEEPLIASRDIFRLPSGFRAFDWQVEVVSRVPLLRIELASTERGLKGE